MLDMRHPIKILCVIESLIFDLPAALGPLEERHGRKLGDRKKMRFQILAPLVSHSAWMTVPSFLCCRYRIARTVGQCKAAHCAFKFWRQRVEVLGIPGFNPVVAMLKGSRWRHLAEARFDRRGEFRQVLLQPGNDGKPYLVGGVEKRCG